MDNMEVNADIVTDVPYAPITKVRRLPKDLEGEIPNPGLPRANVAPSRENPKGSPQSPATIDAALPGSYKKYPYNNNRELTVLQQHVAFFDKDRDGLIYPWDTFYGCCEMGMNFVFAFIVTLVTHLAMAVPSWDTLIPPDPFLHITIKNIHSCKHGSDSEIYDTEGRFVPEKFEEAFSKYAKTASVKLSFDELMEMTQANRNIWDLFGWFASKFEWFALWLLIADPSGYCDKETIRKVFDGTLFYELARKKSK